MIVSFLMPLMRTPRGNQLPGYQSPLTDIISCNFYIWRYLKSLVYKTSVYAVLIEIREQLLGRVQQACNAFRNNMDIKKNAFMLRDRRSSYGAPFVDLVLLLIFTIVRIFALNYWFSWHIVHNYVIVVSFYYLWDPGFLAS